MGPKILVDIHNSCRNPDNQLFPLFSADWFLIWTHLEIGIVFVCQGKDWDE